MRGSSSTPVRHSPSVSSSTSNTRPDGSVKVFSGAPLGRRGAVDEHDAAAQLDLLAGQRRQALDERLGRKVRPAVGGVDAAPVAGELEHRHVASRGLPVARQAQRRERQPAP